MTGPKKIDLTEQYNTGLTSNPITNTLAHFVQAILMFLDVADRGAATEQQKVFPRMWLSRELKKLSLSLRAQAQEMDGYMEALEAIEAGVVNTDIEQ